MELKLEQKFMYDGKAFELVSDKMGIKVFISEDEEIALVTDKNLNISAVIGADCIQNSGFLEIR